MEFYHYFPSVTFVVLTADEFVGRDDGLLEQQPRLWKKSHISSDFKYKSVLATKTTKYKKLRIRTGILDLMDLMVKLL